MAIEVKLPELGDGIESGDVLQVLVKVGEQVEKEQGVVELETDKATVEVPSSHAGRVVKIHVKEGDTVAIGAALVSLEPVDTPAGAAPPGNAPAQDAATPIPKQAAPAQAASEDSRPVQPDAADAPSERPAPAPVRAASSLPPVSPGPVSSGPVSSGPDSRPTSVPDTAVSGSTGAIPAGPAVRRFAREVGVDLKRVQGTGPGGRIQREDVLAVVRHASEAVRSGRLAAQQDDTDQQRDEWGPIRVERLSRIRKTIARRMHESWTAIPRVTNYDDADVTDLERIRQGSKADYAAQGIKLTTMPFVIKAVAMALGNHPTINASVDMEQGQAIFKQYVNVGIAVDTERGLVVPALRGADTTSIPGIARGLATLAENARTNSFSLEDLRGSTFTISNLGAIGGTYSTPIINSPEVAILLIGRSRKLPVVVDDQVVVRLMMPLSLSYDHRLVDGATATRFLNDVIGYLRVPSRLLLAP